MTYEVTTLYTEATVRRAAKHFLVRFTRRDAIIGIGAALAGFGSSLWFGLHWPFAVALGGLGVALVALVFAVGLLYVRSAIGKFRAMENPTVLWRFNDESIATTSELGSAEIKWRTVSEVWRFPEVWLVFFGASGWGYSTIPTSSLSGEVQEYILGRIKAHGGKIT